MYSRLRVLVPICLLEVQTFYREFTFTQNNKIGAKKFIQTHFEGTKCEFQESSLSFFISFFWVLTFDLFIFAYGKWVGLHREPHQINDTSSALRWHCILQNPPRWTYSFVDCNCSFQAACRREERTEVKQVQSLSLADAGTEEARGTNPNPKKKMQWADLNENTVWWVNPLWCCRIKC